MYALFSASISARFASMNVCIRAITSGPGGPLGGAGGIRTPIPAKCSFFSALSRSISGRFSVLNRFIAASISSCRGGSIGFAGRIAACRRMSSASIASRLRA